MNHKENFKIFQIQQFLAIWYQECIIIIIHLLYTLERIIIISHS